MNKGTERHQTEILATLDDWILLYEKCVSEYSAGKRDAYRTVRRLLSQEWRRRSH